MKTKKADFVYKIFFIVVGVILAGLMIAWLVGTYKDKKQEADSGTQKINSVTSSMADFDMAVYDGAPIKGEALRELIETLNDKKAEVAVKVETLDGQKIDYIYKTKEETGKKINIDSASTAPTITPSKKSDPGYITPNGNFIGEVLRNDNSEIVCLKFTQQR